MANIYFIVAFIFALSLVGYAIDPSSSFYGEYLEKYGSAENPVNFWDILLGWLGSWEGALTGTVLVGVALFSGGNLGVVVPFALGAMMANFLIFPQGLFNSLAPGLGGIVSIFFTLTIFIAVMSFVRSG